MARTTPALCAAFVVLLWAGMGCEPQPAGDTSMEEVPEAAPAPEPVPPPAAPGAVAIDVRQKEDLGAFLTDASGRSLYLFEADTAAAGGRRASTCYDECAQAWPPLLVEGEPTAANPAVNKQLLGTVERRDGTTQVTYNGWPLYYFARDQKPGDTEGQDVEGFGGEWYLVTPAGGPVGKAAEAVH